MSDLENVSCIVVGALTTVVAIMVLCKKRIDPLLIVGWAWALVYLGSIVIWAFHTFRHYTVFGSIEVYEILFLPVYVFILRPLMLLAFLIYVVFRWYFKIDAKKRLLHSEYANSILKMVPLILLNIAMCVVGYNS